MNPTIRSVEQLFAEQALESMEVAAAIEALARLEGFDPGSEPTEIGRFVAQTRSKLERRLAAFAGRPEDAGPALERLRDDLRRLAALHAALVGDPNTSAGMLGTRCLEKLLTASGADVRQGMFPPETQRIQALLSGLGLELGPPIIYAGKVGFGGGSFGGMMGMGGMGGG